MYLPKPLSTERVLPTILSVAAVVGLLVYLAQSVFAAPPPLEPVVIPVMESVTLVDSAKVTGPAVIPVMESVTLVDSAKVTGPAVVPVMESVTLVDSAKVVGPAVVPVTESVTLVDSAKAVGPAVVSIHETLTVVESKVSSPPTPTASEATRKQRERQAVSPREEDRKSRDTFSRGTGSVKESGEGSDNGNPSVDRNAGSAWMVVVYVVIGLVAVALFGLLGRRLRRRTQD
jgi:hypothetical protein